MKKIEIIQSLYACVKAIEYLETKETFDQAWDDCDRGDWMLWIASRIKVDHKILTKAKAKCALTVHRLMKDERSITACEVALNYSNGEASQEDLKRAADAAAYAAYAYAYAYAYAAADDAAYAAADDAARRESRQKTADICRDVLTDEVLSKFNEL